MTQRRMIVLGLAGLALVLRLLHVQAAGDLVLGESPDVGMDRWLAMRMGTAVAEGNWLGGWTADYDSAPGYGYWLGGLYWLGHGRWLLAVVTQALLGAAVVPLVYSLGRRLLGGRAGLVAAFLAAFYGPTIFYETLLVKFSLVPVAVACLLLATDRARETGGASRLVLAGLALGWLIAIRGNAAFLLPVVFWWATGMGAGGASVGRAAVLVGLGTAVVLAPFVVRDRIASSRGQGTSLWGIHFYIASHPNADGTYAPVDGVSEDPIGHVVDARQIAEQAAGHALSPLEVSLYWCARGFAFARTEPWLFLRLQARKLRLALAGFEEGTFGDDFADAVEASWVLRLPLLRFGALCPIALLGVLVTVTRPRGALLPAVVGVYALSLLPFFVTGRYRLPLVVPMQLLAAAGLVWLDEVRRRERYDLLLAVTIGFVLLTFGLPAETSDRWGLVGAVGLGLGILALTPPEESQSAT